MMEFLCFCTINGDIESKDPVGYVVVYDDRLFVGPTLEYCMKQALDVFPEAIFKEKCGWVLIGEEEKLTNPDYKDLIESAKSLNNAK